MKFTLQELLEQKALLEKRLELINSRIKEIRVEGDLPHPATPAVEPSAKSAPREEPVAEKTPAQTPSPQPETVPQIVSETKEVLAPEIDIPSFGGQKSMADTRKGCMLWAVLIVGLGILVLTLIYIFYPSWDDEKVKEKWKDLPKEEQRIDP